LDLWKRTTILGGVWDGPQIRIKEEDWQSIEARHLISRKFFFFIHPSRLSFTSLIWNVFRTFAALLTASSSGGDNGGNSGCGQGWVWITSLCFVAGAAVVSFAVMVLHTFSLRFRGLIHGNFAPHINNVIARMNSEVKRSQSAIGDYNV